MGQLVKDALMKKLIEISKGNAHGSLLTVRLQKYLSSKEKPPMIGKFKPYAVKYKKN